MAALPRSQHVLEFWWRYLLDSQLRKFWVGKKNVIEAMVVFEQDVWPLSCFNLFKDLFEVFCVCSLGTLISCLLIFSAQMVQLWILYVITSCCPQVANLFLGSYYSCCIPCSFYGVLCRESSLAFQGHLFICVSFMLLIICMLLLLLFGFGFSFLWLHVRCQLSLMLF